jgi:hypothetical protein
VKRFGMLLAVTMSLVLAGPALAKHKPAFKAMHHTRPTDTIGWDVSYSGSMDWDVTETGSTSGGETWSDHESSSTGWQYHPNTSNGGPALFGVIYPTPCRKYKIVPCPHAAQLAPGMGHSTLSYHIDDTDTAGGQMQSLNCTGSGDVNATSGTILTATYIRGTDSYRIAPEGGPLPIGLWPPDQRCPGPSPGLPTLDAWLPAQMPLGAPSLSYFFAVPSVTIPARTFALYSLIEIPVSSSPRNAPPPNCGLVPVSGETITCRAKGAWSGVLKLTRAPS